MKCGLFDALTGRFADGSSLSDVPEGDHRLKSIIGNLGRLFNTRRGTLLHVPEFGLPDITNVSRAAPSEVESIRRAIRESAERFEPRLRRVRVDHDTSDPASQSLVFLLSAEIAQIGKVQFQTTIRSDDLVDVRQKRASS
jgi:type VI secretion system protein